MSDMQASHEQEITGALADSTTPNHTHFGDALPEPEFKNLALNLSALEDGIYHVSLQYPTLPGEDTRVSRRGLHSVSAAFKQQQFDTTILILPALAASARQIALQPEHPMMKAAEFIGDGILGDAMKELFITIYPLATHNDCMVSVFSFSAFFLSLE